MSVASPHNNEMMDAALDWQRRGFSVVPVQPDGKMPMVRWRELIDCPMDEGQIIEFWSQNPAANIGVIPASGKAMVIDADLYKGAEVAQALGELVMEFGIDADLVVDSASGGQHIWLAWPHGVTEVKSAANALGEGVDCKSSGGYVLVPPSTFSGRPYRWRAGKGLNDCPIMPLAPRRLIDLAGQPAPASATVVDLPPRGESVDRLADAYKALDGRERIMSDAVYHIGHCLIRETGSVDDIQQWRVRAWERFTAKARERGGQSFDDDGRGQAELMSKIHSTQRKLRALLSSGEARQESDGGSGHGETPGATDDKSGINGLSIIPFNTFRSQLESPTYIVDGLIQRGFLYAATGPTGSGKSAIAINLCVAVALGERFAHWETAKGRVLYLAGENPDDVRARCVAVAEKIGAAAEGLDIFFLPQTFPIAETMESVVQVINEVGPFDLIIIDTMAAYFGGDDENNNVQAGNYARELRKLTYLENKPAVLTLCHPVKGAIKGNLMPRGGGAFLNEVDGNLTVWGDGNDQTELHWGGKFRGPNFLPASFRLNVVHPRALVDDKGREMPTVLAEYIEDSEAIVLADDAIRLEDRVMIDINQHAKSSVRGRAERIDAPKSNVQRVVVALKSKKLVEEVRGSPFELMVTKAGHKALERRGLDRPSNGPVDDFDDF